MELTSDLITAMHDRLNINLHVLESEVLESEWPKPSFPVYAQRKLAEMDEAFRDRPVMKTILAQHRANYDLWHAEDAARAPSASNPEVVSAKRLIDSTNQLRNDLTEQIDEILLASLPANSARDQSPLHSETPGLIIDRLSILSLKLYHTRKEIERSGAPDGHSKRNRARLAILQTQRDDLSTCLDQLWQSVLNGERRFKLYRQLKMYNDPSLNPALYNAAARD